MKKINKLVGIAILAFLVAGTATVFAADKGSFTFKFTYAVVGSTKFDLAAKTTTCQSRADSYRYNTSEILTTKYTYGIDLDGDGWFSSDYIGTLQRADGKQYTTSYGSISKNTYTLNISSGDDITSHGVEIEGNGTLYQ